MVNYLKCFEESLEAQMREEFVEFAKDGELFSVIAKDKVDGGCLDLVSSFVYRNPCYSEDSLERKYRDGVLLSLSKEHGVVKTDGEDKVVYNTNYVTLSLEEAEEVVSILQKTIKEYKKKIGVTE